MDIYKRKKKWFLSWLSFSSNWEESVFGALSFAGREILYSHINHETHV